MDKIGLVTITYNSADVLRSFLNCVWKQTHSNFILYVIDNASADVTLSMLENEKTVGYELLKMLKISELLRQIIKESVKQFWMAVIRF